MRIIEYDDAFPIKSFGGGVSMYFNKINTPNMKVAFTGSSGAGKTTLVKYVAEKYGLHHFSSSAGDLFTPTEKLEMQAEYGHQATGHLEVIQRSAANWQFGYHFQNLLQIKRAEIIANNDRFVTDRSPLDNFTYFIAQCGFHKEMDEAKVDDFQKRCIDSWNQLTHVIYIKAVQPNEVEDNGSRIPNKMWQKAIDAQFAYWFQKVFYPNTRGGGANLCVIDFWDLEKRKMAIDNFLFQMKKPLPTENY